MSDLGAEPHEGRPSIDAIEAREVARREIQSDRIQRLQILDYLWKIKRTGEKDGYASDEGVRKLLGTDDKAKVRFHLDTLSDQGLIDIGAKTRGGYVFIKIRGSGTLKIEDFFSEIDNVFRKSEDIELKTRIKQIDEVDDVYLKHDRYIATMTTIGKGFDLGNGILKAIGLA